MKFNVAHNKFTDAQHRNIVSKEPAFTSANGTEWYSFEGGLSSVVAYRYLAMNVELEHWQKCGMSSDSALDYRNRQAELLKRIEENDYDTQITKDAIFQMKINNSVEIDHLNNFNLAGAIVDLTCISLINPCEDPFTIDYGHMSLKKLMVMDMFNEPNNEEFTLFFWKISSLSSMSWASKLAESMNSLPQETQMENSQPQNSMTMALAWDFSQAKGLFNELSVGTPSSNRRRLSRHISNLAKWKHNSLAYLNIFTSKSSPPST